MKGSRILLALLVIAWSWYVTSWVFDKFTPSKGVEIDQFAKPYKIYIKDEHHAIFTYEKDTVILFLENAYSLADQDITFIYINDNLKN